MSKQPKALELAEQLKERYGATVPTSQAAAELCRLVDEVEALRIALRFYANGEHFHIDSDEDWDSVSGEPENWLCTDREGSTTMLENGTVALMALQGKAIDWTADGEDCTPSLAPNEAPASTSAAKAKGVAP